MSINKVIVCGNLTRDPEIKTTAGGSTVINFSVAVNDRAKNPNTGQWEDRPNYIDCVLFSAPTSGRGDFFAKNLTRGSKVCVEGRLRWTQWEAKDGSGKRSKIDVFADEIELMSRAEAKAEPVDAYYEEPLPF